MIATQTAPSAQDLKALMRSRTTEQLILSHALTDAMSCAPDIDDREGSALILTLAAIEAVLNERGVATCHDCGTPSDNHADFCRAGK